MEDEERRGAGSASILEGTMAVSLARVSEPPCSNSGADSSLTVARRD